VKDIYQQVAEEFQVTPEQVEHCWKHQWNFVWDNLRFPNNPAILVNKLGTFSVMDSKLNDIIDRYEKYIERHPYRESSKIRLEVYKDLKQANNNYKKNKIIKK